MSTFTDQLDETGMLICTVINWRNCTDLWMKGMMPKYKSIKDSLAWAIGESLACLKPTEKKVVSIQNHFAALLGNIYILYLAKNILTYSR